ncbi:AMP-binding enzyme C-terminal domain [Teratosphaeria destructans]|uniref:AMP-binding enzyme C-terminal domain n=1 Tax=Teratosphaeria destructans TaxID=418781 RepID=A0A9W7W1F0_9PEZI|nr:AMP-binding enzyme C-terminal domain [Teratosphaeria destructans]
MSGDRTLYTPSHTGPKIFPNHSLFNRLIRFAHHRTPKLCIRDANTGKVASHLQLLTDVLALRERLLQSLAPSVRAAMGRRGEVYIAVLAPGGYEYTVAMLAVLATGAAVVPMTVALPPEEAVYFATKSRAAAVLVSEGALRLGTALEKLVKNQDARSTFSCIPIAPSTFTAQLRPSELIISSDQPLSDSDPAVVIFTSGTTGPPKGSVMRRGYTFEGALAVADHYRITSSDILLHLLPVHHATGLGIMFFPFLISGALIEFKSGGFSPEWTWERWKQGGLTFFSGVPTIYMRMRRHFETTLAKRPNVQEYVTGARRLRVCLCGTSALPKPIADFWTEILGRKILLRYGATEIGAVFKMAVDDPGVPDGSVGTIFAGCDVRLSSGSEADGGQEGEILVKSPEMFSKYLLDAEATRKAHTADGYYRTGDIARKEGEYYWILGRASVDIIKSGGYKISALDIEREILALDYVAEVMVVGVPDEEFGERVAAAVVLKDGGDAQEPMKWLDMERLRRDLRSRLAGYKLPTVLRIIGGELPKSGTGKVVKKILGPQFFPPDYKCLSEVQTWHAQNVARAKL